MAARLALATPHRKAAIIGCGVIGLTTARLLQDRGFDVALYAAELPPHTTSDVAAGAFGVTSLLDDQHHTAEIAGLIQEAVRFAYKYFELRRALDGLLHAERGTGGAPLGLLDYARAFPAHHVRSGRASVFRRHMLAGSEP
jgi:glycine/D-amino acid oxidase-like deaminating enzyme